MANAKINEKRIPHIQNDFTYDFIGLTGLSDPTRENVKNAVTESYKAGSRVIMITGDFPVTAKKIAMDIGLENPDECITGQELQEITEAELCIKINKINVFARVVPEQKHKIVNALKKNKETFAMTGDGNNVAPALKAAYIGVALGEKEPVGTREASSLVLMDDNFSSIVGAIKMGRRLLIIRQ